jgi:TolB-like protein
MAVVVVVTIIAFFLAFEYLMKTNGRQPPATVRSLAILPLENISDVENDYLAGAIQSEIAMTLRHVPDLKVYAGMDVAQMVALNLTKKEIGNRLGVASILEGTIWKEGNRFRLSLFLIDVETDDMLWKNSYEREYDRLMNVVSEVAAELSTNIQVALTAEERALINTPPTPSPEAYDLNLKGWQLRTQSFSYAADRDSLRTVARKMALKALEYDPDYIYPYELIASIELDRGNYDTLRVLGEQMIRKFPSLPGGYTVMGGMYYGLGNYDQAFQYYQKAYNLDRNEPWVNIQLGQIYCYVKKDYIKGIPYLVKGAKLPPRPGTATLFHYVAPAYQSFGDYKQADRWSYRTFDYWQSCESLLGVIWNHVLMGKEAQCLQLLDSLCGSSNCDNCEPLYFQAHMYNNNIDQAVQILEKGILRNNWIDRYWMAYLNMKIGNRQEAKLILDDLKVEIQAVYVEGKIIWYPWPAFMLACVHELLGDKEAAYQWLEKWERTGFLCGTHDLMMKPRYFESMRDDPEFIAIYERVHKEKAEIRARVREAEERGEMSL